MWTLRHLFPPPRPDAMDEQLQEYLEPPVMQDPRDLLQDRPLVAQDDLLRKSAVLVEEALQVAHKQWRHSCRAATASQDPALHRAHCEEGTELRYDMRDVLERLAEADNAYCELQNSPLYFSLNLLLDEHGSGIKCALLCR